MKQASRKKTTGTKDVKESETAKNSETTKKKKDNRPCGVIEARTNDKQTVYISLDSKNLPIDRSLNALEKDSNYPGVTRRRIDRKSVV